MLIMCIFRVCFCIADTPDLILATLRILADALGCHVTSTSWDRHFGYILYLVVLVLKRFVLDVINQIINKNCLLCILLRRITLIIKYNIIKLLSIVKICIVI